MNERAIIIGKIKKCLALSKSANENEAAAALRQAQKLMQQHGVTDFDIETADIQEEATKAGAMSKPARWECALANSVSDAFACSVFLSVEWPSSKWKFVGAAPTAEIARYAFEVMFRQAKRARSNYIKTKLKRCGPTSRTRRADLFCDGWVTAATKLIEHFSGSDAQRAKVAGYLQQKYKLTDFVGRNRSAGRNLAERDWGDVDAGHAEGKNAQLNRGVGGGAVTLALEGSP